MPENTTDPTFPYTSVRDLNSSPALDSSFGGIISLLSGSVAAASTKEEREVAMTLVRWDPFRELEDMSERLNRVFARPGVRQSGKEALTVADWVPTVDISETGDEYLIKAELPEVKKEDVKVTVEDGVLTLQGERKQEKEEKGKKFHRVERSYGSFVRSFTLPESVDEGSVKAEYKDGILTLHLPKTEKVKPKAIEVKVA
jgi:HSP20 family protein